MKNIKEIKGGTYVDESNIDGLDEKKSIHSTNNGTAGTTSTNNNAVISIGTLKDSITNSIIDNVTDNSSIV